MKYRILFVLKYFFIIVGISSLPFLLRIDTPKFDKMVEKIANVQLFSSDKKSSIASKAPHVARYKKQGVLKLYFEPNKGQFHKEVKYLAHGTNHTISLTANEMILTMTKNRPTDRTLTNFQNKLLSKGTMKNTSKVIAFKMKLLDVNPGVHIEALEDLPGRSNYLKGNEPDKWVRNISHYAKVAYWNVYPGIDLIYHGNEASLEYDFVVSPKSDPGQIVLQFDGADAMNINEQGDLVLAVANTSIHHHGPFVYQEINGLQREIAGKYIIKENNQVAFAIGEYNPEFALVIDPVIEPVVSYSTYVGGVGTDQGHDIATDQFGNMYVTGMIQGSYDFPTTPGTYKETVFFPTNLFDLHDTVNSLVFTANPDGYSILATSSALDSTFGPQVQFTGDSRITHYPFDDDYAEVPLPFQFSFQNQLYNSIFVNSNGNVTLGEGEGSGQATMYKHNMILGPPRIAPFYTDLAPIVTGSGTVHADVRSDRVVITWLDVPALKADEVNLTGPNTFQAILQENGNIQFIYKEIDLGNITIVGISEGFNAGEANEIDLSTTAGSISGKTVLEVFSPEGAFDIFEAYVLKFDPHGNLVWSTFFGGNTLDISQSITVDEDGEVYVALLTYSTDLPVINGISRPYTRLFELESDTYVARLSADGSTLRYGTYLRGSRDDVPSNLIIDDHKNAYIAGVTSSEDFLKGENTQNPGAFPVFGAGTQPFIVKLDENGSLVSYSFFPASTVIDKIQPKALALDPAGDVILSGSDNSGQVPTTPKVIQQNKKGDRDLFIAKLDNVLSKLIFATYLGGSGRELASDLTTDNQGNIYIAASTISADFPTTEEAFSRSWSGSWDGFVTKLNPIGTRLLYSTYIGGRDIDVPEAIEVDKSGEVYVTGQTLSANFPVTDHAFDKTINSTADGFLIQLDKNGAQLKYSTFFGGDHHDLPLGISLFSKEGEESINVNIAGVTKSANFPTTPNAFDNSYATPRERRNDIFITTFTFQDNSTNVQATTNHPNDFSLMQNYPNPFNPRTTIGYSIPQPGFVELKIYDVLGKEIQTAVSQFQQAGKYSIDFDASRLSNGVYFYQLKVGNRFSETKKMLYMK